MARHDQDRHLRGVAAVLQLDDVAVVAGRARSASCGLIHAAVSQVSFVSGFGSSCSQPLLAKRPSQIVGSGRKMISSPPVAAGAGGAGERLRLRCGGAAAAAERRSAADPRPARRRGRGRGGGRPERRRLAAVGERRAGDEAVVQRVPPERVGVRERLRRRRRVIVQPLAPPNARVQ